MAKINLVANDIQKTLNELKIYHSRWANDIREGWNCGMKGSKELLFALYEISGSIILALQDCLLGRFRDKMALFLVKQKLENLVSSEDFKEFDALGKEHACNVVTSGTKHHIRIMLETLEVLTT